MKKILIISHWEPWHIGGIENVVSNTSRLLKDDFDIEIYCTGNKTYERIWEGIPVRVFKGYTQSYRFSPDLKEALRGAKYDIIHVHGYTTYGAYIAAKMKEKRIYILSTYFHPVGSRPSYHIMRKVYDPLIGRSILEKLNLIVCSSYAEKRAIMRTFKSEENKLVVIPIGVNLENIKSAKPFDFRETLILYVGRLEKYKNVHHLIQTMKHLPEDYKLNIIGSGHYKYALIKLIQKMGIGNRVKILENLSDTDVYRWMKTSSLFITLSEVESFGLTVIEALAAGTPVLVNNKTALAELVNKFDGMVFGINVNEMSSQKISEVIMDKINININANLEEYRWKNITNRLEGHYNRILESNLK